MYPDRQRGGKTKHFARPIYVKKKTMGRVGLVSRRVRKKERGWLERGKTLRQETMFDDKGGGGVECSFL